MKKPVIEQARLNLRALIASSQTEVAANFLRTLLERAITHQSVLQLGGLLCELPHPFLAQPSIQPLYLQTLCRARKPEAIERFFNTIAPTPALRIFQAWAWVRAKKYQAALELLGSLPQDPTLDLGLFWRTKGEALFWLGNPAWQSCFEKARPYLSGAALGRTLLDQGSLLQQSQQRAQARVCWSEALVYLQGDPYYLAWVRNNLGLSLLKDQPQTAEGHLLESLRLSHKEVAREFRSRAYYGLGGVRRALGEHLRALSAYHEAIKTQLEVRDHQDALWGYGHTLRLMGQVDDAHSKLLEALQLDPDETWIHADIAATRLMMSDAIGAEQSLSQVKKWAERSSILRTVIEAELLRRQGNLKGAKGKLHSLDPQNLWVREELSCFPQLQPYLPVSGPNLPSYRVEVNPYGTLEVKVNGRPIPLAPICKAAEVLVFLLVNGQQASREMLVDAVADQSNKGKRQALWQNIRILRNTLGWRDSIQHQGGIYRLDPSAEWVCSSEPEDASQEFMHGYYSEWIREKQVMVV